MHARHALSIVATLSFCGTAVAGSGLTVPQSLDVWPQWQARISIGTATLAPVRLTAWGDGGSAARQALQSGAVLSDFYLDAPGLRLPSSMGGLRATGGLMIGPRGLAIGGAPTALRSGRFGLTVQNGSAPLASDNTNDAVPYLGVGYTGLALKGGWGVTADLGLVAERPGAARALFGTSGLESTLREMRISPVLQLGVSYAF